MNGVYRIVFVQDHGFGWFAPEDWGMLTPRERDRALILATVETEQEAKKAFTALPQYWEDAPGLHYRGGQWWQSTGEHVTDHLGQVVELFLPIDYSLPVLSATTASKGEITTYTRLTKFID